MGHPESTPRSSGGRAHQSVPAEAGHASVEPTRLSWNATLAELKPQVKTLLSAPQIGTSGTRASKLQRSRSTTGSPSRVETRTDGLCRNSGKVDGVGSSRAMIGNRVEDD